jgi:hypothetical protein
MHRLGPQRWFVLIGLMLSPTAWGQGAVDRPFFDQLNQQTESLYHQVSLGVVRVQLPTPRPTTIPSGEFSRLPMRSFAAPGVTYIAEIMPAESPAAVTADTRVAAKESVSASTAATMPNPVVERILLSPNVLGIVIDDKGHVLLPVFAPAEIVGSSLMPVVLGDGHLGSARFVASDRKTNLTVLQMVHGTVHALAFSSTPLPEGEMVMLMTMDPSATHLGVWSHWANDWGLVIRTNGSVAGFSARGRFISASACAPVAQQLIDHGHVDRAFLGVGILFVGANDPQRQVDPLLGQSPAIRIIEVIHDTPAERVGLRVGDLILSLAGQPVDNEESFAAAVAVLRGNTELKILRQGQIISVTVDLEPPSSN